MPECGGKGKWSWSLAIRHRWWTNASGRSRRALARRANENLPCATLVVSRRNPIRTMLLSKEYVGYLAREVTKKLIAGEFIETKAVAAVTEKVHAAILDELSLEDRIND